MVERITKAKSYLGHDSWQGCAGTKGSVLWPAQWRTIPCPSSQYSLNNLQRFLSMTMGRLSNTFLKQPKNADKPHRIAMILSSTTVNQEVSPLVCPAFIASESSCTLLSRVFIAVGVFKMERVCPAGADRLLVTARD